MDVLVSSTPLFSLKPVDLFYLRTFVLGGVIINVFICGVVLFGANMTCVPIIKFLVLCSYHTVHIVNMCD